MSSTSTTTPSLSGEQKTFIKRFIIIFSIILALAFVYLLYNCYANRILAATTDDLDDHHLPIQNAPIQDDIELRELHHIHAQDRIVDRTSVTTSIAESLRIGASMDISDMRARFGDLFYRSS